MRHLLRALARVPDPLSDAALLARYAADRDPAAFEVLVWRHGGMVLGVCRRHLRDAHAAEDAFQATFLVLSRKAGTVRGDTLPGWLHRVARRAATRATTKAHRRRETALTTDPPSRPSADGELSAVLDAEIDRLPDRLRQVVVMCYLDGETTEAAAARLGIPRGTVLSRLHTARAALQGRLTRRGVTPPVVGLTALLTAEQVAGGVRAASGGFGPATILANEVLAMSGRKTVLAVAVGLVLAGGAGTGVGVLTAQTGGPPAGSLPVVKAPDSAQAQRLAALKKAEQTVDTLIRERQRQAAEARVKPGVIDPAALQAALTRIGEQLLAAEFALREAEPTLAAAQKQPEEVRQKPTDPAAVDTHLQKFETSGNDWNSFRRAEQNLRDYLLEGKTDPEMTARFQQRIEEASTKYQQSADKWRKRAEVQVRELAIRNSDRLVKRHAADVAKYKKELADLSARRDELSKRLADQTATTRDDELDALRDLRRDLARRRLAVQLDLPAETDAVSAAILARLTAVEARLAELKPK